jgi:Clr5 domain
MSGSVTNSNPIDPEWDLFKEAMRILYLVECRSLEEVRNEMKTKYQFSAT